MDFDRISVFYDQEIVPIWGQPFAELLISEFPERIQGSVLEIGCATGYLARYLSSRLIGRSRIIGLESSCEMLEIARKYAEQEIREKKLFFVHNELKGLRFADDVFDLVFSNLGLHYLPNEDSILYETLRVLKPGSRAFFSLPLRHSFTDFFGSIVTFLEGKGENRLRQQVEAHAYEYREPEAALYLLRSVGFEAVELKIHPFKMIFEDGYSLIQSPFVRFNFLEGWFPYLQNMSVPQFCEELTELFDLIRLNSQIELSIQASCLIGTKEEYLLLS